MEFHCLWLTTQPQYKLWRPLLSKFPLQLTHQSYHSYSERTSSLNRKKVAFCIWSEEEFHRAPKYLQKLLFKKQKPSLLVVKNHRFAVKAFELGFSHCIEETQVGKLLIESVTEMLASYFKPTKKSQFLQNKLWFVDKTDTEKIYFIPFPKILLIKIENELPWVHTLTGNHKSSFPFKWLTIQCQNQTDCYTLNAKLILNIQHIQSLKKGNRNNYTLTLCTFEKIQLSNKEGLALKTYLNPKT